MNADEDQLLIGVYLRSSAAQIDFGFGSRADMTPVALILFKRPEETARVIEALRLVRPSCIFAIADGARDDSPGEVEACRAARAQLARIDWPAEVVRNFSDSNLGLKRRVETGLNWVFSQVSEAVILEDDCVPHPSFFPFCEELLERYRDEQRVMSICGSNFLSGTCAGSYYFSRYPLVWGWATWRRAWNLYDPEMRAWKEGSREEWLARELPDPAARRYWKYHFDRTATRGHTWDYAWTHACWRHHGLSVIPHRNLTGNIGFGDGATHTFDRQSRFANLPLEAMPFPLEHPDVIAQDRERDALLEASAYSGEEFLKPMFRAIRAKLAARR